MAEQSDLLQPLVCPGEDYLAGFIYDECRVCGRRIKRHESWPSWVWFICVPCFVEPHQPKE